MASGKLLAEAKSSRYRGLVKIPLPRLSFPAKRPLSERNVARLLRVFELEGCKRYQEKNYVDITVNAEQLDLALSATGASLETNPTRDWDSVPTLDIDCHALYGQHRVAAAARFLDPNDRWWIAKVYTDSIPATHITEIEEEYANEQAFSDGEVVIKIRKYHRESDEEGEKRWWARLSATKRKELRQLLRDKRYAAALDNLLCFPGLWCTLQLGCLHRLLTMKCDDECLRYLAHIARTWTQIMTGIEVRSDDIVDSDTVRGLETLAPYHASGDAAVVHDLMQQRVLFANLTGEQDRSLVLENILSIRHMIPSLYTFFEHLKHLEPCAKILRSLLPSKCTKSIYTGLSGHYLRPSTALVEYASADVRPHGSATQAEEQLMAYVQLWLFAMRNFPDMTCTTPRKDIDGDLPIARRPNPTIWQEFGSLALALGFQTTAAQELAGKDGRRLLTLDLVASCNVDESQRAATVEAITDILQATRRSVISCRTTVAMTSDVALRPDQRCGRPFQTDFEQDIGSLFLPNITQAPPHGQSVTTFFTKCDLLRHFFDLDRLLEMTFDAAIENEALQAARPAPSGSCRDCENSMDRARQAADELTTLRSALDSSSEAMVRMERETAALQQDLTDLRAAGDSAKEKNTKEVEQLRHELTSEKHSFETYRGDRHKLEADLASERSTRAEVESELSHCREAALESNARCLALQQRLDEVTAGQEGQQLESNQALSALRETLEPLEGERRRLEGENKRLEGENKRLEGENKRFEGENKRLEEEISCLRTKCSQQTVHQENTRNELARTTDRTAQLDAENRALQEECAQKSKRLMATIARAEQLLSERTELDQQKSEHISLIESLQSEVALLKDHNEVLDDGKYQAETANLNSRRDVAILGAEIESASQKAIQLEDLLVQAAGKLTSLQQSGYTCSKDADLPTNFLVARFVLPNFEIADYILSSQRAAAVLQRYEADLPKYHVYASLHKRRRVPRDMLSATRLLSLWKQEVYLWFVRWEDSDAFFAKGPEELRVREIDSCVQDLPSGAVVDGSSLSMSSSVLVKKRKVDDVGDMRRR